MGINESASAFGPQGTLIGVLAEPAGGERARVGCLLLNTGVNPRIGPRRLNVKIARAMARAGVPALRFDLAGIGDSRASGGMHDYRQQAVLDMRAALDHLQAHTGLARFVVFGDCSGAVNAMALALADTRIVGLATLDGEIFPTKGVRIERKLRRWAAFPFNPALRRSYAAWGDWVAWMRAPLDPQARQRALARLSGRAAPQSTEETGIFDAGLPPYGAADFERDTMRLLDRGVDVYLMFSATINVVDHDRDLLRQLRGSPMLERVRYRFWPDIDHTVTLLSAQRKLIPELCDWARKVSQAQPAGIDMAGAPARQHAADAQQPLAPLLEQARA